MPRCVATLWPKLLNISSEHRFSTLVCPRKTLGQLKVLSRLLTISAALKFLSVQSEIRAHEQIYYRHWTKATGCHAHGTQTWIGKVSMRVPQRIKLSI